VTTGDDETRKDYSTGRSGEQEKFLQKQENQIPDLLSLLLIALA
jgi:hypothetical protein